MRCAALGGGGEVPLRKGRGTRPATSCPPPPMRRAARPPARPLARPSVPPPPLYSFFFPFSRFSFFLFSLFFLLFFLLFFFSLSLSLPPRFVTLASLWGGVDHCRAAAGRLRRLGGGWMGPVPHAAVWACAVSFFSGLFPRRRGFWGRRTGNSVYNSPMYDAYIYMCLCVRASVCIYTCTYLAR